MTLIIVAILAFFAGMMAMALIVMAHDSEDRSYHEDVMRELATIDVNSAAWLAANPPLPEEEDDPNLDIFAPYVEGKSKFFDK